MRLKMRAASSEKPVEVGDTMFLWDRKAFFVHVPKTGGSSIEAALIDPGFGAHPAPTPEAMAQKVTLFDRHQARMPWNPLGKATATRHKPLETYRAYARRRNIHFAQLRSFTIVRDPWSRVFSHWKYALRMGKTEASFTDFVCREERGLWACTQNYARYVGAEPVHMVLRFERLGEDFARLCTRFGWDSIELPHTNRSSGPGQMLEHYTPEAIDVVRMTNALDIGLFGYTAPELG